MRLALISDVHANLAALEATLADIAVRSINRIVCLGDIVGYNTEAAACIALLRRANGLCVAGNHDLAACGRITTRNFSNAAARAVAWTRRHLGRDELDFLCGLPLKADIYDQLIAVHGALHPHTGCESVRLDNDERRAQTFEALAAHRSGARICAFGHTHQVAVYELWNGQAMLRPIVLNGQLVEPLPDLNTARDHAARSRAKLPAALRSLEPTEAWPLIYSKDLTALIERTRRNLG